MNMEQIKESLNESWKKSLMQIGVILVIVIFFLEMLVFSISYIGGTIDISVTEYFLKKILLPTGFEVLIIGVMFFVYKSKSVPLLGRGKEIFLCYSLFMILVICVLTNRYYHVLWVAPCACQYLHSVYADKKAVRQIYIVTDIFIIICTLLAFMDEAYKVDYLAMTIVCAFGMLYIFYSVAKLLSGFHSEQLEYLQESYKRQEQLITELKLDPMTGLYNKNAIFEKLTHLIDKKEQMKQTSYLAMLDLDYFKRVNDTYGHVSGDEVIRHLAKLIKKHINTDIVGVRFGGEEFMILFQNKTIEQVLPIIEQICEEMRETQFEFASDLRVTLSAGVAEFDTKLNRAEWIQKADEALYYAKKHGRNQIKIAK